MHALDVVSLGFKTEETEELFLLFLEIDGFGSFAHAAWWVWTEPKEISEDVRLLSFLEILSGTVSSSCRAW